MSAATEIPTTDIPAIAVDPTAFDSGAEGSDPCSAESQYSTQSLTSSIYDYRYENGRRYNAYKAGHYLLPNDESEQDRLDIVHHVYALVLNDRLHLAPIDPHPQNILDIGTGTGIWAIDVAERYPSAHIIGTDLSPIQPSWVPPNVEFQIDDAELPWTFKKDHFDLIHIRHLAAGITNWKHIVDSAFEHCRPGGWVDLCEYEMDLTSDDGTITESLPLWQFFDLVAKATIQTGRDFGISTRLTPLLRNAGFINITHEPIKIPLGTWPADKRQKEIGAYVLLSAQTGFEAFGIKLFTGVMGMTKDEAEVFLEEVKKGAGSRRWHGYSYHHFYYAQKPEEEC